MLVVVLVIVIVCSVCFCGERPKEHIEHEGAYEGGPWILPIEELDG